MSLTIVGPIVGGLGSAPVGSAAVVLNQADRYDIGIGDLGFRLAIDKDRPYERATAQFRKDQFDSSNTYGDQSLLGYWTRGQFTFHKGAGVRYYEVSEGEEVLDRFNEAEGVLVNEPGEVSLEQDYTTLLSSLALGVNPRFGFHGGGIYYGSPGGTLFVTFGPYAPVAGAFTSFTSDDTSVWVSTDAPTNAIEISTPTASSGTTIYTHSTGIKDVAYVKGRLFCRDDDGNFYQLAARPGAPTAIAPGDLMFTLPQATTSDKWYFCDTRAGVYITMAGSRVIYQVSIDQSDGTVPTLSAPVVAAELPEGETIVTAAAYLGHFIMVTSLGVRVAIQQADGALVYGPLLLEATTSVPGTISAKGSLVYAAAGGDLYSIDLGQTVGQAPLEFAWTKVRSGVLHGSQAGAGLIWSTDTVELRSTDLAPSGSLTTGFHRFGTIENKKFQTVQVRAAGQGSIEVSRVMADGSVISLYVLPVSGASGQEITLGLPDPLEMVGLKFTLNRSVTDATQGPTLLGYQLRALPAPTRQRMIRLPLMAFDVERRGAGRSAGGEGQAWERLNALEDMERSGGTFPFKDFRTDERGEVFIETVEYRNLTPPGSRSNGMGGTIFLTLRKL